MTSKLSAKDVWVVMPGFNEEKYLEPVLKRLLKIFPRVVFVDDGSSDQTAQIARKNLEHVLVHSVNLGKGAAMKTGCEYAFAQLGAKAVIFMDSDDQHNPEEIPKFIELLKDGYQTVFGVRKFSTASMPLTRFLGNKLASAGVTILFGSFIPDIPSGFKAITKSSYSKVKWQSTGYEVEMEIAVRTAKQKLKFAVVEIETIYRDQAKGMNVLDALGVVKHLLQWRIGM